MYCISNLTNDLRVATYEMEGRNSVSIGILVGTGGRYEEDRLKGAAHFLEHLMFKGSRSYSCRDIKGMIEGVGGSLNAFTSEEVTAYYAKIPVRHFEQTYRILVDMVLYPVLSKRDIAMEKGVILEELKMYRDLPQYLVGDLLDSLLWPDHPLGKHLAGSEESIGGMTRKDLIAFHKKFYMPRQIVVAACGNIRHQKLVQRVRSDFSGSEPGCQNAFVPAPNLQLRSQFKFCEKNIEQMHLAFGMLGLNAFHPDRFALNLLHVILGGNMSSRLFDEIREKRGLAYSIGTMVKGLSDTGVFMVRAGVKNENILEAVSLILKELDRIKNKGVTSREFERARQYYLGQFQLALEDTLDHMLWIGEGVLLKKRLLSFKEIAGQMNKLVPSDIRRIAAVIIHEDKFNLAVVGPLQEKTRAALGALIGAQSSPRR